jgi:hypothetical protein
MPLINFQTDLRSLKFQGSGRENREGDIIRKKSPYIITPIPGKLAEGPQPEGTDYLFRQNTLLSIKKDESRFFNYFKSPSGIDFILKQNQLSKSGVKAQMSGMLSDGIYLPTSTLAQLAAPAVGGHFLKQGVNPLMNTVTDQSIFGGALGGFGNFIDNAVNAINDFEGIPVYVKNRNSITEENNNRLLQLADKKIYNRSGNDRSQNGLVQNAIDSVVQGFVGGFESLIAGISGDVQNHISNASDELIRYDGGPGSHLGIVGQTGIRIAGDYNNASMRAYSSTQKNDSGQAGNSKFFTLDYNDFVNLDRNLNAKTLPNFVNTILDNNTKSLTANPFQTYLGRSLNYEKKQFGLRVNLGNPGATNVDRSDYQKGAKIIGQNQSLPLDKVNALQIYKSFNNSGPTGNPIKNDFVKFRFGVVDNKDPNSQNYIHFRAIIDSFSDNYSAEWSAQKYMGRAESFYRYTGMGRSINISWTVAAQSRNELIPMYQKLNYLASTLSPDYTEQGYMAGNIVNMTIGGWCFEQPGFITAMTLNVPQNSPWEIGLPLGDASTATGQSIEGDASVKEMPMMVKVTGFTFTPIHNFVPKVQSLSFEENGTLKSFGDQRYIALENEGRKNNYTNPTTFDPTTEDAASSKDPNSQGAGEAQASGSASTLQTDNALGLNTQNEMFDQNLG